MNCKHTKKIFIEMTNHKAFPIWESIYKIRNMSKVDKATIKMKTAKEVAVFYCPRCNTVIEQEVENVHYQPLPIEADEKVFTLAELCETTTEIEEEIEKQIKENSNDHEMVV
ncbi:MAG: hypothetical protein NWE98_02220 [Candidatus Bathyarchaeota archaeon]|nr:hypothetical protein [Candidatus Bathyarchaeota archaeon]